jgi:LacI family transcriptional regulator
MLQTNGKKITISDIALRAKVSITTVSRVLNDSGYVSEDKRQAVLLAIDELNYRPNLFAQGLASGQSSTVGVLTQLIASPIYDLILRGVVEKLNGSKFSPLIADGYWNTRREKEAIQTFVNRSIDGLIILGGSLPKEDILEIAERIPTVIIARDVPELSCQSIFLDDYRAAYEATQYLINSGHRRIVHISGLELHNDAINRRRGYFQALADANIAPDPNLIIPGDFTETAGILAVESLLTRGQHFSAIFAANDQMAYGARLALYRRGIRVPQDISLVGFDDQPPSAYMTPPLTTVGVPALEIGHAAATGLLEMLRGEACHIPAFSLFLRIRESVARH